MLLSLVESIDQMYKENNDGANSADAGMYGDKWLFKQVDMYSHMTD